MSGPPLRIAYLNQDFFPEVGAGPARILEMSRRWQARGAEVTIIAGMPNRRIPGRGEGGVDPRYSGKWFVEEEWDGVRTLRTWVYTGSGRGVRNKLVNMASFTVTGLLQALTRRLQFDVIIGSSPPYPPHLIGAALAAIQRVPLVLEIRDLWPDYMVEMGMIKNARAQRALFALERMLLARADHTVVVTESFRERIVGKGVPRERSDVIPNGVDLDQYYASTDPPPLPELTRRSGELLVGYLGTFGRGQALSTVVRAAAIIAQSSANVRFVLAGDGPDLPAVREELERSSANNVSIVRPIRREQTRAFYNACDISLVPLAPLKIFQETVPSKMFEIMACERLVVAALSGEGAAIVQASGAGLVCPPGDPVALADAVLAAGRISAAERAEMGRRGRAHVTEHYSRAALGDRYFDILNALVTKTVRITDP